jgi:hypothetical protein
MHPPAAWRVLGLVLQTITLTRLASNVLELFLYARQTLQTHPQHPLSTMASVYKTLSGKDNHEKEPEQKRNKQRVLILVFLPHATGCVRADSL